MMKSFLIRFVVFVTPFLLVGLSNYSIDNAHLYASDDFYRSIGAEIAKGNHVANLYNYDEFLVKKYTIAQLDEAPEVLCLGSSRTVQINENIFPDKNVFNMSVSAASLRELIACYSVVDQKDFVPDTIVLGLDPFTLVESFDRLRYSYVDDYNTYATEYYFPRKEKNFEKTKLTELFSPLYFYDNLKYGAQDFETTEEKFLEEPVICSDGSYVYKKSKREFSEAKVLALAKDKIDSGFDDYRNAEMSLELQEELERFIKQLKSRSHLILWISPYHPHMAKKFGDKEFQVLQKINNYYQHFAQANGIEIIGDFLPWECGMSSKDFYDGEHPKRASVEHIFHNYFESVKQISMKATGLKTKKQAIQ